MKKQLSNLKKAILVALLFATSFSFGQDVFSPKVIKQRMENVTRWQLNHPKHKDTDWTNGAFYAGVVAAYQTTQKQWILDSLLYMANDMKWQPDRRFDHADDVTISQTYLALYDLKKDRSMIQATLDTLKNVQTTPGPEAKRHGITWWWCDALFMAPPVFGKMAAVTGDKSLLATNDTLFQQCYDLLYNKEEHLFARDASYLMDKDGNIKLESNGKKIFWSRGNGWVMGGLVRLLEVLPADYPKRSFYENLYKEMAYKLKSIQQTDGLWRSSLLDPNAYPGGEASGTGFDIYAMAWGINHGLLPKADFLPTVKKGWVALNTLVKEDGMVGWVQPIGADPRRNFNSDSWEVYGSGAYLLAASEVIKLKK